MSKTKQNIPASKAGRIRDALALHGWNTKPETIVIALKREGIEVSVQDVTSVKFTHNHPNYRKFNLIKKSESGEITVSYLRKVKFLKDKLGSFIQTRQTLDLIESLGNLENIREALDVIESFK